ncbi:MAG: hypothetical protein AAF828_03385 [Bacteroidota bacterium]
MNEPHHLFPSGQWSGFYTYANGPTARQSPMPCVLNFADGKLWGSGTDEVGSFNWQGSYDTMSLSCQMIKIYVTHSVNYVGHVDENGIWGRWTLSSLSGGFHLWPNESAESAEEEEVAALEMM